MIETKRCLLTEVRDHDLVSFVRLKTETDVRKFLGGPIERKTAEMRFVKLLNPSELDRVWAVRAKENDAFIGLVTLNGYHNGVDTEVSYEFLPEWWGQGYATEAVGTVVGYMLRELKLPRVVAETQMANTPSRRLLERLGFHLEKTIERFGAEQAVYVSNV